jgi:chemotaxis regulatin CheY-phosphate phosphatase CheZ
MEKSQYQELEAKIKAEVLQKITTFIQAESSNVSIVKHKMDDAYFLQEELKNSLNEILNKINSARDEISAISMMAKERNIEGFGSVEDELSTIVTDTEQATNKILDAADEISDIVNQNPDNLPEEKIQEIQNNVLEIILACSFQDITGQRVQKVVEVIQLIDNKIDKIEKKLSNPNNYYSKEVKINEEENFSKQSQKDAGLLNGPALPSASKEASISQDSIDNLFDD